MNKYNKVILKLSGQYIAGNLKTGIDFELLKNLAAEIKKCKEKGIQIGIVIGGGNFWRGAAVKEMNRACADYVGMLATIMNSLILCNLFNSCKLKACVQTLISMPAFVEDYSIEKANEHINSDEVVIFGGGSGSPYFSTDTAAVLRAIDIKADIILKATHTVDGVYDKDPMKDSNAKKLNSLTFNEAIEKHLKFMDETAMVLCKEHNIPVLIFNATPISNISKAIVNGNVGTIIK